MLQLYNGIRLSILAFNRTKMENFIRNRTITKWFLFCEMYIFSFTTKQQYNFDFLFVSSIIGADYRNLHFDKLLLVLAKFISGIVYLTEIAKRNTNLSVNFYYYSWLFTFKDTLIQKWKSLKILILT